MRLSCIMLLRFISAVIVLGELLGGHAAEISDGELHNREFFYVGGEYVTGPTGETFMKNQMYVERLWRGPKLQPHPLVLIHGKGMSGANTWLNTPDGRRGWASYFISLGYDVYIVDQPTRGRSAWLPGDFSLSSFSVELLTERFTAPERARQYPQSRFHTQWPGNGTRGDASFDAFCASTLQFLVNDTAAQLKTRDSVVALLDLLARPVTLLVHSQGGFYAWAVADARPRLVKAIVAVEPAGPPFRNAVYQTSPTRAWGLTDIPVAYEPPAATPDEIRLVGERVDGVDCVIQAEPARQLPNLRHVPVLVVTAEASYHALYDACSVRFLQQAGVPVESLRLADAGIYGNGHLMMMEKNNLEIAEMLHRWIRKTTSA